MGKVKVEYDEFSAMKEKIDYQEREIQRMKARNDRLESALTFAKELIPKERLPDGVGINVVPWLINQGQNRTWRIKER